GGQLDLFTGAQVSGGVVFGTGGTLLIGGSTIPANLVISNFAIGDVIDLASIAFSSSGTTSTSGNVLTISEGRQTHNLSFSTNLSGAHFTLAPDGGLGTDITLGIPVSSGQTVSITSGQTSGGLVVLSGGTVDVFSGGVASATTINKGGLVAVFSSGTVVNTTVSSGG